MGITRGILCWFACRRKCATNALLALWPVASHVGWFSARQTNNITDVCVQKWRSGCFNTAEQKKSHIILYAQTGRSTLLKLAINPPPLAGSWNPPLASEHSWIFHTPPIYCVNITLFASLRTKLLGYKWGESTFKKCSAWRMSAFVMLMSALMR